MVGVAQGQGRGSMLALAIWMSIFALALASVIYLGAVLDQY